MNEEGTLLVAVGAFLLGCVIGTFCAFVLTTAAWEDSCQRIGAKVAGRNVYECRIKP